jgi:hypothetical protein
MHEYTRVQTTIANLPYGGMVLTGIGILVCAFGHSIWALIAAASYFLYGITGTLWIMLYICPHCTYYNTRGCPCGYGSLSAKLVHRGTSECFAEKFKRHIPVIVPLWLIPLAGGVSALIRSFTWWVLGLLIVFIINSYVVLPLLSTKHSCLECPQKEKCPWMGEAALFHSMNRKRDSKIVS